jgi:hypothetical protein
MCKAFTIQASNLAYGGFATISFSTLRGRGLWHPYDGSMPFFERNFVHRWSPSLLFSTDRFFPLAVYDGNICQDFHRRPERKASIWFIF